MLVRLFVHSFIHAFIHPSTHASIHSFMHSFIHASMHPFIHAFIYPRIHASIHPSIRQSIHPSISFITVLLPALCQVNTGCSHALATLEFCHSPCQTPGLLMKCADLMTPACEHTTCTHMSCCMFPMPVVESKTASM